MGLVSLILLLMAAVGFLTFGFTKTVCGTPSNRTLAGTVQEGTLIINGYTYDLGNWFHPSVGEFNGSQNPLFTADYMAGGKDASFMFQKVNENCRGIIGPSNNTGISPIDRTAGTMAWYFPCESFSLLSKSLKEKLELELTLASFALDRQFEGAGWIVAEHHWSHEQPNLPHHRQGSKTVLRSSQDDLDGSGLLRLGERDESGSKSRGLSDVSRVFSLPPFLLLDDLSFSSSKLI